MPFRINNFLEKIKKYAFKYKNGFYITPFLANSPKLLFESIKGLPFNTYDDAKKRLTASSIFVKGILYFYEVEEGLWVYFSEMNYKVNHESKLYYDPKHPADYHILSLNIVQRKSKSNTALLNGITFSNCSWNILKPKCPNVIINFKGTVNTSVGVYMSETWVKEKLNKYAGFEASAFQTFFSSVITNNIWQEDNHNENGLYEILAQIVTIENEAKRKKELYDWVNKLINYLIAKYPTHHSSQKNMEYDADLHRKMLKVENKLIDTLLTEFPGIDTLAESINVSATKLKNDFKHFFGEPIYQYYMNKKLEYAYLLLKNTATKIKEVSRLLNYDNEANFTRAFKAKYSSLPSQIKKLGLL